MKAHATQMVEGPEAFEKFRVAMKTIMSVPKTAVADRPKKRIKKKPASRRG